MSTSPHLKGKHFLRAPLRRIDLLSCFVVQVSSLKERGQAHVPESLPAPLQDGGELHWLTVFLCSSEDYLREQFELGMVAGNKPGVLLLALCVTVQGLSVMQD